MTSQPDLVFVGCYTQEGGGKGEGIALLRRDPDTGALTWLGVAAVSRSPSFLAQHPALPVLYAVNELEAGSVSAFSVAADGSLAELAVRSTGGSHPCHLAVTADGRHLLAANYVSGSVSVHPLDLGGVPGERSGLLELDGQGPDRERQQGPHAHMVAPDPAGPGMLIVDLGSDRVWSARLDPAAGRLTDLAPALVAAPGTGPRHLLRSAGGALLLVGELGADLSWYRQGADGLARLGDTAASTAKGTVYPSELAISRDGRFVYVGNRGPNTISVFTWRHESATLVAEVSTGGDWPRHLALIDDHLYVANERSHTVTAFQVDPDTGIPGVPGLPIGVPSPTCVLRWIPSVSG